MVLPSPNGALVAAIYHDVVERLVQAIDAPGRRTTTIDIDTDGLTKQTVRDHVAPWALTYVYALVRSETPALRAISCYGGDLASSESVREGLDGWLVERCGFRRLDSNAYEFRLGRTGDVSFWATSPSHCLAFQEELAHIHELGFIRSPPNVEWEPKTGR